MTQQTFSCGGNSSEYFSYTNNGEADNGQGCQPLLQEGEVCGADEYYIKDLTNQNNGCVPGLSCLLSMFVGWMDCGALAVACHGAVCKFSCVRDFVSCMFEHVHVCMCMSDRYPPLLP